MSEEAVAGEGTRELPDGGTAGPREETRERTYFTIAEASERLDVRPHVLRYWETQFPMLRPKKGRSGSRMYRTRDLELLQRIKTLLYEKGFTIKGAKRRLRVESKRDAPEGQLGLGIENPWLDGLNAIRDELAAILGLLRQSP